MTSDFKVGHLTISGCLLEHSESDPTIVEYLRKFVTERLGKEAADTVEFEAKRRAKNRRAMVESFLAIFRSTGSADSAIAAVLNTESI